jgi:hypothetical protein
VGVVGDDEMITVLWRGGKVNGKGEGDVGGSLSFDTPCCVSNSSIFISLLLLNRYLRRDMLFAGRAIGPK